MANIPGQFCQTTEDALGKVIRKGDTVSASDTEFVVEAIYQEMDRRTGSCTFVQGRNGSRPVPARSCRLIKRGRVHG